MGGAKTACAFVPENYSPMGAGMGAGMGVPPWGGGCGALSFHLYRTAKKVFKKLQFCVDNIAYMR